MLVQQPLCDSSKILSWYDEMHRFKQCATVNKRRRNRHLPTISVYNFHGISFDSFLFYWLKNSRFLKSNAILKSNCYFFVRI